MSLVALQTKEPIPGYRLRERLGAGGYGEVWKAEATGGLFKAIKFVYGQLDEDRASRELKALHRVRGVRHPFILSLERIEVIDGQLIIVTELADCSLKDCYEKHRKQEAVGIPRDELLLYMRDAADALDYMNKQHSLQHLDVKPENLLLTAGRIKVADFGLVKDINEHTVSMMGGLTPVYAPPEVFEGSPSHWSDQYSLAIVFQEMLTGQLPFPGKTAAQLAAQHLNAKPRVAPLPEGDREAILRALSKKPEDRFASCVELVEALQRSGRKEATISQSAVTTAPNSGLATEPKPNLLSPTEGQRTMGEMLDNLEQASRLMASEVAPLEPAGDALDLPPPDSLDLSTPPRPTLFIGVGGAASKALQKLRHRWEDRLDPVHAPPVQFLSIDTDVVDLMSATRGDEGAGFTTEEIVEVPLRKSQDYRQDSGALLGWLSRRWLYNIPRSLKTEGLRPLGRLALVDHAPTVMGRIREAIVALRDATQARHGDAAKQPSDFRVTLVASSAGGSGGGMIADLIFAVRQILDEVGLGTTEVDVVLFHCTNRVPAQQELAEANTFATLRELAHYHQPEGFPGDVACQLAPRSGPRAGADAIYTILLGRDLSPEQFGAGLERLAEFLFLGAATQAAAFLSACRREGVPAGPGTLRSFGLCQVGFSADAIVDQLRDHVCREALSRWIGGPRVQREKIPKTCARPALAARTSTTSNSAASLEQLLVHRGTEMIESWKMKVDPILSRVVQLAQEELGDNLDGFLLQLAGDPNIVNIAAVEQLFGPRDPHGDAAESRRSVLRLTVDDRVQPLLKGLGSELKRWIECLAEDAEVRFFGARWMSRWFRDYLKLQNDQLRELRQQLQRELDALEPAVRTELDPKVAKSSNAKKAGHELILRRVAYCKLRLHDLAALATSQLFVAWQSYVAQAADGLQELTGDLEHWCSRYPEHDFDGPVPQSTLDDPLAGLRPAVAQLLDSQMSKLAAEVETKLTKTFCPLHGGVRGTLLKGGDDRVTLTRELERLARQAVLRTLSQVNMLELLLQAQAGDRPLVDLCLEAADPRLPKCGGERRLACLLPSPITENAARQVLQRMHGARFHSLPTILPALGADVILLYEIGKLSLPHVASRLVDGRPDIVEIADRLQTRADVDWRPLPVAE